MDGGSRVNGITFGSHQQQAGPGDMIRVSLLAIKGGSALASGVERHSLNLGSRLSSGSSQSARHRRDGKLSREHASPNGSTVNPFVLHTPRLTWNSSIIIAGIRDLI